MIFNYIRVSTISQNTDQQLVDVPCDRIFTEHATGKDVEGPQLQAMLSTLHSGDQVNIHELSCLARNTKDLLAIVE
ncbi:hypothetical protein MNBD_GAMMA10-2439 [hydrothermal vent metagenome]|uniref:Resolvase/invertase-type recombinase catalytic domain-containing protein n=1 Tax=hydrothermal vent metagenome TaxID=652676 RepID=A0A3B0XXL9_9ZZZZ